MPSPTRCELKKVGWSSILVAALVLFFGVAAEAQQTAKVPRIGFLSSLSPSSITARTESFRQGLHELGYMEGKNIVIEWRYAEGNADRLKELAAELVRLKVDIIVTGGPAVNRPAKEATATIPIVLAFDNDPVGNGFAASLARPGGNITGLSTHYPEISGKQLELLKEIVPKLSRVAVLGNSTVPGNEQALRETELAAGAFGVKLQYLDVQNPKEIELAFRAASKGRAEAVLVLGSQVVTSNAKQFAELAVKRPAPGDLLESGVCRGRRSNDLQREHYRLVQARRHICGQDFKRRKARQPANRAAEKIRIHHQSQSGEADRLNDSAERAGAGGQGD